MFGSITKPLIERLLLRNAKPAMTSDMQSLEDLRLMFLETGEPSEDSNNNQPGAPKGSSLRLLMRNPTSTVHYFWRKFDDRYMRSFFGGRGFVPFVPSSPTGAIDESSS